MPSIQYGTIPAFFKSYDIAIIYIKCFELLLEDNDYSLDDCNTEFSVPDLSKTINKQEFFEHVHKGDRVRASFKTGFLDVISDKEVIKMVNAQPTELAEGLISNPITTGWVVHIKESNIMKNWTRHNFEVSGESYWEWTSGQRWKRKFDDGTKLWGWNHLTMDFDFCVSYHFSQSTSNYWLVSSYCNSNPKDRLSCYEIKAIAPTRKEAIRRFRSKMESTKQMLGNFNLKKIES